ncbi:hypothetical protein PR048_006417 [Dryococelus australis]|uniref:Uncharacterized protein n=1 Tax=Dryococelus australis TaxID=614101 RepID=A0ABQ9IAZ1_9NEOP|nr:hypothetical protein PR048_006417 [Dryococelus australis]
MGCLRGVSEFVRDGAHDVAVLSHDVTVATSSKPILLTACLLARLLEDCYLTTADLFLLSWHAIGLNQSERAKTPPNNNVLPEVSYRVPPFPLGCPSPACQPRPSLLDTRSHRLPFCWSLLSQLILLSLRTQPHIHSSTPIKLPAQRIIVYKGETKAWPDDGGEACHTAAAAAPLVWPLVAPADLGQSVHFAAVALCTASPQHGAVPVLPSPHWPGVYLALCQPKAQCHYTHTTHLNNAQEDCLEILCNTLGIAPVLHRLPLPAFSELYEGEDDNEKSFMRNRSLGAEWVWVRRVETLRLIYGDEGGGAGVVEACRLNTNYPWKCLCKYMRGEWCWRSLYPSVRIVVDKTVGVCHSPVETFARGSVSWMNGVGMMSVSKNLYSDCGMLFAQADRHSLDGLFYTQPYVNEDFPGTETLHATSNQGATVAERLAHLLPTKANWVQSPAGPPNFEMMGREYREKQDVLPVKSGGTSSQKWLDFPSTSDLNHSHALQKSQQVVSERIQLPSAGKTVCGHWAAKWRATQHRQRGSLLELVVWQHASIKEGCRWRNQFKDCVFQQSTLTSSLQHEDGSAQ